MKRNIIIFLVIMAFCSGCGIFAPYANLTPKEKSIVCVETFSSWYYNTHKELEIKYANATAEEKEYLAKNVAPKMNKLRPLIKKYDKLVLLWQETNTSPEDITATVTEIERLIFGIVQALK